MAYACIDVGSNTTRLLVAALSHGRLRELSAQRAFTRIGRSVLNEGAIPESKLAETAEVVASQARAARELGAQALEVVGTAVVRDAPNGDDLVRAVEAASGLRMRVLSGEEEARLAFVGAARTLQAAAGGELVVVDVGGWSTEVVAGTLAQGVSWWRSFGVGSGLLADSHLHSDPPSANELEELRHHVRGVLAWPDRALPARAVAVGGSAASVRRLVGRELGHRALRRSLELLSRTPAQEVAARIGLHEERVRLMPAGIVILDELAGRLGMPLELGNGGLREGVVLELADAASGTGPGAAR